MTRVRLIRMIGCAVAAGVTLAMASCGSPSATDSASPSATVATTPAASPSDPAATALPTDDSSATPTPTPSPTVSQPPASSTMEGIEATGGFNEAPTVTIPSPWAIDKTQTKILVQGDGPTVSDTGYVQVNYYGVDARTGTTFDESYTAGTPVVFSLSGVVPGFQKGLAGQKVGTRLIIAMPGADGYDSQGGKSDAGIAIGDTLVFVVDILQTQFTEPTGETQVVTDSSLPKVSDDLAAPTVTIATADTAPTEVTTEVLIKGEGPQVQATDSVIVNYAEYVWSTGKMVRQTYGYSPLGGTLASTIPGWQKAIAGQTTGSRLLVVVPPDQAYPEGAPKIGVDKGSTMVYVIDVLFDAGATS